MKKVLSIPLILLVFILLGIYAAAGLQSRYLADDYCYDAEFIDHGFIKGQVDSYINLMPYSSNRYSLTLFSGLAWVIGGIRISPFLPSFALISWACTLFYTIHQLIMLLRKDATLLSALFTSVAILFYTILLAPNQYQVLYWRSGMLPYLFPLIFNTFLAGRFLHYLRSGSIKIQGIIELGFLAWIAAGFSETVVALQVAVWGIVLVCMLVWRNKIGRNAGIVILVCTGIGAALLILNPTNGLRQSPFPTPPSILIVASHSVKFAMDFFISMIKSAPLPVSAILGSGALVGLLESNGSGFQWRRVALWLLGASVSTGILLVCIMAPTMWAMSAYPENRGLLSGVFIVILYLVSVGFLAGLTATQLLKLKVGPKIFQAGIILISSILFLYFAHFIPATYKLISTYQARAAVWDARDSSIRQARVDGQLELIVPGIDSIAGIMELQPNENHWVNVCAARYYGVDSIRTTE